MSFTERKCIKSYEFFSAPPSIVSSTLKDREVFATQSCRFEVKTSGIPRPEAKWFKDGEPLKQSEKFKWGNTGDNYYLTVNRCESEDQGIYSVILTSKLGSCEDDGHLTVAAVDGLRKPKFIKPLTDGESLKDGACTFKAVVTGEPIPDATWFVSEHNPINFLKNLIMINFNIVQQNLCNNLCNVEKFPGTLMVKSYQLKLVEMRNGKQKCVVNLFKMV